MNFLNHAVRLQDEEIFPIRGFDHRAIIARGSDHSTLNRQLPQQRREQRVFANSAQFHC
jgi:hypothetical protein